VKGSLYRWLVEPERPTLVIEVRPGSLGVASLVPSGAMNTLGPVASMDLPAGTLQLSLTQPNIADPSAFGRILGLLLERSGLRGRRKVGLVLPDPVARVGLIPSAEINQKGTTVPDMIRFRLKKVVPFDVGEARIASLPGSVPGEPPTYVVAAIAETVLRGYEEALTASGLETGLVEVAGLTLGEAAGSGAGDHLLVNWDQGYVSFLLFRSGWPILVRTLVGPGAEPSGIAHEVSQTLIYYRERLSGTGLARVVVRAAHLPFEEAQGVLSGPLEMAPEALDPWAFVGGGPQELRSEQGLAGALACLRRAAA
jgi:type IV pilus assembly protein PilM